MNLNAFVKWIFICLLVVCPQLAAAHPGGLNADGCHHNRKTGDYHCHKLAPATRLQIAPVKPSSKPPELIGGDTVMFNTNTRKFHGPSCRWAQACTRNCISLSKGEAVERGGVPCKVCGGY